MKYGCDYEIMFKFSNLIVSVGMFYQTGGTAPGKSFLVHRHCFGTFNHIAISFGGEKKSFTLYLQVHKLHVCFNEFIDVLKTIE